MTDETGREGGCLCGAVRFRAGGMPNSVVHCHCGMCRRAGGAPVVTWATYPNAEVAVILGEPRWYRSSDKGRRAFCATCGSPLFFQDDGLLEEVDITVCTFDRPEDFEPDHHCWSPSRLPWVDLARDLPDYVEGSDSEKT